MALLPRSFSPLAATASRVNSFSALRQSAKQSQLLSSVQAFGSVYKRNMASAAPKKPEWIVIVPDMKDALQKRIEVRPKHLSGITPFVDNGFMKMGGATLTHHPKEGETPPMNGSVLIVQADTIEEIRETLAKDIYTTSGVWDVKNATIYPFRCALNTYVKA